MSDRPVGSEEPEPLRPASYLGSLARSAAIVSRVNTDRPDKVNELAKVMYEASIEAIDVSLAEAMISAQEIPLTWEQLNSGGWAASVEMWRGAARAALGWMKQKEKGK